MSHPFRLQSALNIRLVIDFLCLFHQPIAAVLYRFNDITFFFQLSDGFPYRSSRYAELFAELLSGDIHPGLRCSCCHLLLFFPKEL